MKKLTRAIILSFILALLIIPQAGCNAQAPKNYQGISKTSFHLDTVCTITVYSLKDGALEASGSQEQEQEVLQLITEAFKLCDDYEKELSRTVQGSDIYRINHAGGQWVEVEEDTIEVLEKGLRYGELSGGRFDITIGDVSALWDFHEEDEEGQRTGTLPDEQQLAEAVTHVDYRNIEIDGRRVRLKDPAATIDLGGIAKGYIADRTAEFLQEKGVTSAIVDLGGNIVIIGQKGTSLQDGAGSDFSIGIASPVSGRGELLGAVTCSDKTVVTSGTYERYFEIDGVRYHHVLDPENGYPFATDLLAVTVIGERGMSADCDGLSTTCLALGSEEAAALIRELAETEDIGAVLVDEDGEVTVINVDGYTKA